MGTRVALRSFALERAGEISGCFAASRVPGSSARKKAAFGRRNGCLPKNVFQPGGVGPRAFSGGSPQCPGPAGPLAYDGDANLRNRANLGLSAKRAHR